MAYGKKLCFLCLLLIFNFSFSQTTDSVRIELRGVWISTVKMLDYPSRRGLNSYQLKQEYIRILDSLQKIHVNAIFFQVRPAADAFFASKYEPWSEWLTGRQGQPPKPFFDPLKFFIQQAHARGMQFHAWINPFRAIATIQYADVLPSHISKTRPQWFFDYGLNRYFNPGIPQVRDYIVKIIADVVRRYDVDGIHFDDYFYPYPVRNDLGRIIPIPDRQTFKKYHGKYKNIKNWRRHNITLFIQQVHDTIKSIKPWVAFGVSPCAVWRNKSHDRRGSKTRGLAAYDWLYADILLWDSLKLVDYIAPQLYYYIGHKAADYRVLLNWWAKNIKNSALFIGLNIKAIDPTGKDKHWGNPSQIPAQIRLARKNPRVKGFILYSSRKLLQNPLGIYDTLKNSLFADSAVVPQLTPPRPARFYLAATDTVPPNPPQNLDFYFLNHKITVLWQDQSSFEDDTVSFYTVYLYNIRKRDTVLLDSFQTAKPLIRFEVKRGVPFINRKKYAFRISATDKAGNQSRKSLPLTVRLRSIEPKPLE